MITLNFVMTSCQSMMKHSVAKHYQSTGKYVNNLPLQRWWTMLNTALTSLHNYSRLPCFFILFYKNYSYLLNVLDWNFASPQV